MHALYRCLALALLRFTCISLQARAQISTPPPGHGSTPQLTHFAAGLAVIVSEPKEEFRRNVRNGFGVGGTLKYYLDRSGWVSLLFDPSWI